VSCGWVKDCAAGGWASCLVLPPKHCSVFHHHTSSTCPNPRATCFSKGTKLMSRLPENSFSSRRVASHHRDLMRLWVRLSLVACPDWQGCLLDFHGGCGESVEMGRAEGGPTLPRASVASLSVKDFQAASTRWALLREKENLPPVPAPSLQKNVLRYRCVQTRCSAKES
jgi:hypothetical protein